MLKTESILTPEEIQLCLVLKCLIEQLAILKEQIEILDRTRQKRFLIVLP